MLAGGLLLHWVEELCLDDSLGRVEWSLLAVVLSPGFQGTPDKMSGSTGAFWGSSRCPDRQSI